MIKHFPDAEHGNRLHDPAALFFRNLEEKVDVPGPILLVMEAVITGNHPVNALHIGLRVMAERILPHHPAIIFYGSEIMTRIVIQIAFGTVKVIFSLLSPLPKFFHYYLSLVEIRVSIFIDVVYVYQGVRKVGNRSQARVVSSDGIEQRGKQQCEYARKTYAWIHLGKAGYL